MPQFNVYAIGQTTLLEAFNTDDEGDPVSPVSPKILLRAPNGVESSLEVTEDPVGHVYHELYIGSGFAPGRYYYRIVTQDDALENFFVVHASAFTTPLP